MFLLLSPERVIQPVTEAPARGVAHLPKLCGAAAPLPGPDIFAPGLDTLAGIQVDPPADFKIVLQADEAHRHLFRALDVLAVRLAAVPLPNNGGQLGHPGIRHLGTLHANGLFDHLDGLLLLALLRPELMLCHQFPGLQKCRLGVLLVGAGGQS